MSTLCWGAGPVCTYSGVCEYVCQHGGGGLGLRLGLALGLSMGEGGGGGGRGGGALDGAVNPVIWTLQTLDQCCTESCLPAQRALIFRR